MEKGEGIEGVNGEIHLPEAIIQHILSLLSGKEAARTSILSKSWYRAWLTRPNLDFDQRHFRRNSGNGDSKSVITNGFPDFAMKTVQMYEESNQKIVNFRLCMYSSGRYSFSLANKLIVKAMKMGARNLNVEFESQTAAFVLPHEVLGSKTLIRLSAIGCKIDLGADKKMENRRRIEAINGEILLPEAIIQHIQSFLSGKEAAQTSILSKSWYRAWSTRPNLDFDQRDFENRRDEKGFWEFAKKTMRRYEELNLKIQSFRLWMKGIRCVYKKNATHYSYSQNNAKHNSYSLAKELIVKAMKMAATDLCFELECKALYLILPDEVLGCENLVRLSVNGCKIDGNVSCSRLKSLSLSNVYIEGEIIWDIISSCPLIEELSLSECKFLLESHHRSDVRMLALSPFIEFGKRNVGSVVDGPIHLYEFHKLKCLFLGRVEIHTLFFRDFSSRFPCLKDLTFSNCSSDEGIKICSRSLECISFEQRGLRAKFDVPSIRKFSFSGSILPSLSFETASNEWESDISISCDFPNVSWFRRLNKCLRNLSQSKVSLSLDNSGFSAENLDFQGFPKPVVVENFMMQAPYSICSPLLMECLFRSCHPKFITLWWLPDSCYGGMGNNYFLDALCQSLMQKLSPNSCIGRCDLEEVNVEHFEETLREWRPLLLKKLLDASANPAKKHKIRFRLRWG